jgi:choline dehydrogenase-like flavoprotein
MAARRDGLEWDYVIVGSGAGGGTLAARLVEAGASVFLIEAGGDARASDAERMPDDYDVPAFHAYACENPAMSWDFHVRHYGSEARQARDPKYRAGAGVLYPRAATLGGCTAHNAMIYMPPHESDWNHIADQTGDSSWRAARMRRHARRVEDCRHAPAWRALRRIGIDPTGHGWDGWLRTEKSIPLAALGDEALVQMVRGTTRTFVGGLATPLASAIRWLRRGGDPNARPLGGGSFEGLCYTPLSTRGHRRAGTRERLLDGRRGARRPPPHRARRARHPRPPRRHGQGTRRRLSQGQAPLPRPRARQRRRRRGARSACDARGDPLRRHLQHAAAADALGHRPGGAPARARHRGARRPAGRGQQFAGPL